MNLIELFAPVVIGGLLVALMAGPLGSLLLWRRLSFFGDTLAHSALLGIALSIFFHLPMTVGLVACGLIFALILSQLLRSPELASDTALLIISSTALSVGLILLSLQEGHNVDVMSYLLGDLLAVSWQDLWPLCIISCVVLGILYGYWQDFVRAALHEELAEVEGLPITRLRLILLVLLALAISAAIQLVGVLLITALLIIPAAGARFIAKTPVQMAVFASMIGAAAVLTGLALSFWVNTPLSPSIVLCTSVFFAALMLLKKRLVSA